jgi:hypothetical protein
VARLKSKTDQKLLLDLAERFVAAANRERHRLRQRMLGYQIAHEPPVVAQKMKPGLWHRPSVATEIVWSNGRASPHYRAAAGVCST